MNFPARAAFAAILYSQFAFAAIWNETGNAGPLPATAQNTLGTGSLEAILGELVELDEVDTYLIRIVNPFAFSAATVGGLGTVADPKLFLFNINGVGVYMNDDANGSQSQLPAGHPLSPTMAGLYYLSIARFDNTPLSAAGNVFRTGTGVMGRDPVGGALPVSSWNGDVTGRIDLETQYAIELTGSQFANIPEPSTYLLIGAGIAWLFTRRAYRMK